jgi:hypothetical protein
MDYKELQNKLIQIVSDYDEAMKKHPEKKACFDKFKDLKDSTLSVLMSSVQGTSEAEKKRNAMRTAKWSDYLVTMDDARLEYEKSNAKIKGLEMRSKVFISLLSFEKEMIVKAT